AVSCLYCTSHDKHAAWRVQEEVVTSCLAPALERHAHVQLVGKIPFSLRLKVRMYRRVHIATTFRADVLVIESFCTVPVGCLVELREQNDRGIGLLTSRKTVFRQISHVLVDAAPILNQLGIVDSNDEMLSLDIVFEDMSVEYRRH